MDKNFFSLHLRGTIVLDPQLCELLVCPLDHGPLLVVRDIHNQEQLYNPRLRRIYRIDEDIPVLLVNEARIATDDEHAYFTEKS